MLSTPATATHAPPTQVSNTEELVFFVDSTGLYQGDLRTTGTQIAVERAADAEQRLKRGDLAALVATSSLELGIDVGDVDLVIQLGPTPSIAAFLQRVGRAGHAISKTPKGRLFPLTRDELVTAAALMHAVANGDLDRTQQPDAPLDILAQQIVATCCDGAIAEQELFELVKAAYPSRVLPPDRMSRMLAILLL